MFGDVVMRVTDVTCGVIVLMVMVCDMQ
jgi:hypothetical protein